MKLNKNKNLPPPLRPGMADGAAVHEWVGERHFRHLVGRQWVKPGRALAEDTGQEPAWDLHVRPGVQPLGQGLKGRRCLIVLIYRYTNINIYMYIYEYI